MDFSDADAAVLASQAYHLMAAKMFSLACCVMLFYDILITFGDEVEKIWKQRFSFATVLWFMNRYLSPLGYIVVIVSFHDPNWSKATCNRYVLYPEVLKIFTSLAIGIIFILRLYSIYGGSLFVLFSLSALLLAELAVKIWAFTDGTSVNLPPGLVGCILTGRSDSDDRFVFTWVAELIFDSIIFVATLSRTLVIYRRHRQGSAIPFIRIMMRDGIVYFLTIFAANVVTVTLFLVLPPDLKAINASFSTLITSLMVSRLILNLRNQASRPRAVVSFPSLNHTPDQMHLTSNVIGNLGEPVESHWLSDVSGSSERGGGGYEGYGEEGGYGEDREVLDSACGMDLDNLYCVSDTVHQTASMPSQIIVEITKSVTTDFGVGIVDINSINHIGSRNHSEPQLRSDLASKRFDDFDDDREDDSCEMHYHPLPAPPRPRSMQHSQEIEREGERARNKDNDYGSRDGDRDRGINGNKNDNGSGNGNGSDGREGRSPGETWQPPQAWMLDSVDQYELGRVRRSNRRPSTS